MRWQYFQAYCSYEVTKRGSLFHEEEGFWALEISGRQFSLTDGMDYMGEQGWELVAVQPTYHRYGGTGSWHYIPHWYIFKRPLDDVDAEVEDDVDVDSALTPAEEDGTEAW
jgi:hypothetical protein